jgi:hypothetical protein
MIKIWNEKKNYIIYLYKCIYYVSKKKQKKTFSNRWNIQGLAGRPH